jgi:predicted Zn-dependent protease
MNYQKLLIKTTASLIFILFLFNSCSKVPFTGRRQMKAVPNSSLLSMSFSSYSQFLRENKVVSSGEQAQMVKNVGAKMQAAVTRLMNQKKAYRKRIKGFKWEFNLVDDKAANAWCMPGGKVVFYTGIMPICMDETGVAVVMGHEIAHAIASHGNERMSQGLATQLGGVGLAVAMQNKSQETQTLFMTAFGIGSQVGVMLPFSRLHESEADKMGLIFMAMAGYDPAKAIDFWQRMEKMSGGGGAPEFLSTHPAHSTRINNIKKWLPQAQKYYKK